MQFPSYVHSVVQDADTAGWPVQGQGENECGCTVAANALNLLAGKRMFDKDDFVRQAGLLFQRGMGGSPSPITGWLIKQHGGGTHFGNLSRTNAEAVLRDLIRRNVPVVVELWRNMIGPFNVYGQHSVLLVGYSDPHPDNSGTMHEEYYFVDSQWPQLGKFSLTTNDTDVDGNPCPFPGNHTIPRQEFLKLYQTRIYFPVFPSQAAHDEWYRQHIDEAQAALPLFGNLTRSFFTGSYDLWRG